ncbi:MAG: UTP--glucose-1-phosphate uridylyltransferase [Candidatus Dichloromethanomonas elyunquensis]|nr:MAG: UTP--glucose-1-phosphate uridylyltransferase [Candidatus Dichloromethanomonas elyunquensis]
MKAMILAAGIGTRLRPLTDPVPKPMVPILNTPVMEYSVKLLRQHGITDIAANTHYNAHFIEDYFGQGESLGVHLHYTFEKELLGTAGGVRNNRHFLDETFFVLSGDALTDINLTDMYKFHQKNRSLATIALKSVKNVSSYGVVVTDRSGSIKAFQEKPKKQEALSNVVNTGIYLFEPEIFDLIPEGFYDFGRELFPKLLEIGARFFGYVTRDYWCDIGAIDIYQKAHREALHRPTLKEMASKDGIFTLKPDCVAGMNSTIDLSCHLGRNVFIGKNCNIGTGVYLDNCIIWDNCTLLDNAVVQDAIIGMNCFVGANSTVRGNSLVGSNSLIGRDIVIDKKCSIEPNSILVTGKAVSA